MEIARKYDLIHSQREALGMTTTVEAERALLVLQDKHVGCDEYDEYVHIFAYKTVIIRIGLKTKLVPIAIRRAMLRQSMSQSEMMIN